MAEGRTGGRRTGRREDTAALVARLEARVTELETRLARLEGGEVRVLKAGLFDGRARARPQQGPKCPGCRLVVDVPSERCPFCGLLFRAIPASQRPVGPPRREAAGPRKPRKPAKRGEGGPVSPPVGTRRRRPGSRAGA